MYCSINEAFQDVMPTSAPKPRRKKRPALPPEPFQIDPDRPANRPPSEVPSANPPSEYTNLLKAVEEDNSYFLHEPAGTEKEYMLEPDWTRQFEGQSVPPWIKERIAAKDAEIPLKASVEPVSSWMQGLYQRVPSEYIPSPTSYSPPTMAPMPTMSSMAPMAPSISDERLLRLESRLDKLFDKLEAVEKSRSESNHIEIILFILGGLFLILMLDLLVKQGTRACMMVARAGGGQVLKNLLT
jgi:hypothetical protein